MTETINTANIAFAALNDGTFISNFDKDSKDGILVYLKLFKAINNHIGFMDQHQATAFSLALLLEGRNMQDNITERIDTLTKLMKEAE